MRSRGSSPSGETPCSCSAAARGPAPARATSRCGAGAARDRGTAACDLEQPEGFAAALDAADAALGGFDTVVVTAGLFATQDRLEAEPDFARRLLTADFANTVVFCEEARRRLLAHGGGTLCVFSSVAGDAGASRSFSTARRRRG